MKMLNGEYKEFVVEFQGPLGPDRVVYWNFAGVTRGIQELIERYGAPSLVITSIDERVPMRYTKDAYPELYD
jgi:hypothetical protein